MDPPWGSRNINFSLKTNFQSLRLITKPKWLKLHVQNPSSASPLNDLAWNCFPIPTSDRVGAQTPDTGGNQLFRVRKGIGHPFVVPLHDALAILDNPTACLGSLLQPVRKLQVRADTHPVKADTGPSCSNLEIDLTVIENLRKAWSKILEFCHEQEHDVGWILRLNDPELQELKLSQALIGKLREILRLSDEDMLRVGLSQDLIDMLQKLRSSREE